MIGRMIRQLINYVTDAFFGEASRAAGRRARDYGTQAGQGLIDQAMRRVDLDKLSNVVASYMSEAADALEAHGAALQFTANNHQTRHSFHRDDIVVRRVGGGFEIRVEADDADLDLLGEAHDRTGYLLRIMVPDDVKAGHHTFTGACEDARTLCCDIDVYNADGTTEEGTLQLVKIGDVVNALFDFTVTVSQTTSTAVNVSVRVQGAVHTVKLPVENGAGTDGQA